MSRHENSNQFKDGLLMDLHPLQTPNTVLTDCLNGTFITYNGNEYSLQNDMGNFKLKNCRLSPGYLPIGSTSYADTIYLLSYNPIDDKIEVGSYPSPVQYNDSSNTKYHQIPGLLENYLMSEQKVKDQIKSNYIINQSDLKKFIKSVSFDGKEFRLKSGDEYAIRVENTNLCEFEKFNYEVIFDSGKKQKFNPELTKSSGTVPVPWDTPGNIKISNHLFEFNQSSNRIVAKRTFRDKAELDILYELFVVDPDFNKILSDDVLENKIIVESQMTLKDSSTTGKIKRMSVKPWLDNYQKIEYVFTFVVPTEQNELEGEFKVINYPPVTIQITPKFKTQIDLVSKSDIVAKARSTNNINDSVVSFEIIQDEHVATLNIDLDDIKVSEIGDTNFYWTNDNKIIANYTQIDGYLPYYRIHEIEDGIVNDNTWIEAPISGEQIVIEGISLNSVVAISFCYRENVDESNTIPDLNKSLPIKNEIDVVTKVIFTYHPDKMNSLWNEYCGIISNDENPNNDALMYGLRYDLIPFESIYKDYLKENLNGLTNGVTLSSDFGIIHDVTAKQGEFYKYFEKFSKETDKNGYRILFPSIVEKAPESHTSDQCFEIPRDATLTLGDIDFNDLGEVDSNTIKDNIKVQYVDRKDISNRDSITLNLNSENKITLWNKVKGEVQQKGDLFYFADNVEYSRLTEGGYKGRFDAVTLDQDGKKKGDFQVNCEIDGQEYTWKSLDIQNYRAIRMGYPDAAHDMGESVPCRQMDFAGYGESGLNTIKIMTGVLAGTGSTGILAGGIGAGVVGAAMGATAGAVLGATGILGAAAVGVSVLAGSITALASLESFNKRKLTGMCNYIGNFHKHMRNHIISSGKDCLLTTLKATTFYRDKAQRPTFTVNGVDIITPDWKKWKNDECENGTIGSGENDTRHFTNSKTCLAFRVFHDVAKDGEKPYQWGSKLNPINPTETIEMTEDYEYWVKISGSEQHSVPIKKGEPKKIEGIGLVGSDNSGWYKAWIDDWDKDPTNDKYYFRPHTQTEVVPGISWMAQDTSNWCGQLFFRITIPDEIYNQFEAYKLRFLESNFENLPKTQTFDFGHEDVWKKWENGEISTYFEKLNTICSEDKNALKEHPIFKCFVNAGSRISDRVKNWPVAGVYPDPDANEGISGDVFDSIAVNNMPPWEHMYVNGKGTVYLTNLKPENQMYICKNNKKQVFGYFPYISC